MKVLYSHHLGDDGHPAARMVGSIAGELENLGHDVVIHASRPADSAEPKAGAAPPGRASLEGRLRGRLWFARTLLRDRLRRIPDLRAIERHRPDVVLARHDAYRSSMAWAAARAGVPLVTYADAPVAHEVRRYNDAGRWHPPGLVEAIERRTIKASRRVVTVSRPAAEILQAYRTGTPIDVAPNGVAPPRFPALGPGERLRLREELGIRERVVVGFQGTFKPFHGLDRLRALIASTTDRPEVRWLLIGDGPGLPGLRASFGEGSNVTFLGRRRPEEMGRLLSAVDIAVAPYEVDSGPFYFSPLKILEYAAAGCAVLAADQGDIASMLDEGRAARLVDEPGIDAWTAALAGLIADEAGRSALGAAARRWTLGSRTWTETARAVAGTLGAALSTRDERPRPSPVPGVIYAAGGAG